MGLAENVAAMQQMIAGRKQSDVLDKIMGGSSSDSEFNQLLADTSQQSGTQPTVDLATGQPSPSPDALGGAVARRVGVTNTPTPAKAYNMPLPKSGQLNHWVAQALGILKLDPSYAPGIEQLIMHESGGNPNAINNWDSNAKAGHPSQGLMQTIPGTFSEYALPGHGQILNPVDNIIAGTRYALKNYGTGMLKAGGRHDASGHYIGY